MECNEAIALVKGHVEHELLLRNESATAPLLEAAPGANSWTVGRRRDQAACQKS